MKKTLAILGGAALLATRGCEPCYAQQIINCNIVVTNAATNGYGITFNGGFRLFTNNAVYPASQIAVATNGSTVLTASNLFMALARSPLSGATATWDGGTNVALQSFPGYSLSASTRSNWATLTFSTNTLAAATVVRVPKSVTGPYERTNVASGLVDWLNDPANTNKIDTNSYAFADFVKMSTVVEYFHAGSNYATYVALQAGTNANNNLLSVSNKLLTYINSFNLNLLDSAAFKPMEYFQPACAGLSNLCDLGTIQGLSYIEAGTGNILLANTNATERLRANENGDMTLKFEDGTAWANADTAHNITLKDHSGYDRVSIYDVSSYYGATIVRSHNGNPGLTITGNSGAVNTFKPMVFNNDPVSGFGTPCWAATVAGTTTNFVSAADNSGTAATTVNLYYVPANTMTNDGDTVTRTIGVQLASGTSSKRTEVYFAGTQIFDTGAIANGTAGSLSIRCEVTRINSSTVSYSCSGIETDSVSRPFAKVGTIGGLDFTSTQNFYEILTASGTGAGDNQATVILDNTMLKPSAAWSGIQ